MHLPQSPADFRPWLEREIAFVERILRLPHGKQASAELQERVREAARLARGFGIPHEFDDAELATDEGCAKQLRRIMNGAIARHRIVTPQEITDAAAAAEQLPALVRDVAELRVAAVRAEKDAARAGLPEGGVAELRALLEFAEARAGLDHVRRQLADVLEAKAPEVYAECDQLSPLIDPLTDSRFDLERFDQQCHRAAATLRAAPAASDVSPANAEARALGFLAKNPRWTNQQIATAAGCHVKSLSRMKQFRRAKAINREVGRGGVARGFKDRDGQIEAYDD